MFYFKNKTKKKPDKFKRDIFYLKVFLENKFLNKSIPDFTLLYKINEKLLLSTDFLFLFHKSCSLVTMFSSKTIFNRNYC